jgi:hypothetical protein
VKSEDIYLVSDKKVFDRIFKTIKASQEKRIRENKKTEKILILVDDLAGTVTVHGSRFSPFANLSIQTPHWNTSMIVITQQPTSISPSFRDNAEGIIVFPSEGELEIEWLKRCYQSLIMETTDMKKIILTAWRGGRNDNEEWGQHFLYIECLPRRHSKFYIDFKYEINL